MKIAKLKEQQVLDLGFEEVGIGGLSFFTKEVSNGLTDTSLEIEVNFQIKKISLTIEDFVFFTTNDFTLLRLELILLFFELDNAFEE